MRDACRRAMRLTLVARHQDVLVHLQVLGQEVAESVVLLLDDEVGRVGHAWEAFSLAEWLER